MKFLLPIALLAAGAMAADDECNAQHIVETCLVSETAKFDACATDQYDCLCAAQQSIVTCYNNCPNDSRAPHARGQVEIHCGNASVYAAPTPTTAPKSASETGSSSDSTATSGSDSDSGSEDMGGDGAEDAEGAAGGLVLDFGGLLLGVAGVMAVVV